MTSLTADPTPAVHATPESLQERLHRIERAIEEQQDEYRATRQRIEAAGDGVYEALEHAADLALNLQTLYRRDLDLRGRLAAPRAFGATNGTAPPDRTDRLRRVAAQIARRKAERSINDRRIEELRTRDDPTLHDAISDGADIDEDLRGLQDLEATLRRQLRGDEVDDASGCQS